MRMAAELCGLLMDTDRRGLRCWNDGIFRVWDRDSRAMSMGRVRLGAGVAALVVGVALIAGAFALGVFGSSEETADDRIAFLWGPWGSADDFENDPDWEIYVMNADGSGVVQLTDNDAFDLYPAWSPDRKRILFTSDRDNDFKSHDIYVMNADGSGVEQLTDGCSNRDPSWSPDGERIAYASRGDIYVMDSDGSDVVQLTGTPDESCGGVFINSHEIVLSLLSLDFDSAYYYYRNEEGTVEPLTDSEYKALNLSYGNGHPVWSPDGDRIAFLSNRSGSGDIYVMNVDGSGVERLTEGNSLRGISWSPDGERIVFDAGDIYVMNADGSDVVQLTDNYFPFHFPSWSPDGERIAFFSYDDFGIKVMNLDGSGVVRLGEGYMPAW